MRLSKRWGRANTTDWTWLLWSSYKKDQIDKREKESEKDVMLVSEWEEKKNIGREKRVNKRKVENNKNWWLVV